MYKARQTFCLDLFLLVAKNWKLFNFALFVLLCKLPNMKTKGSVYNAHIDFGGQICEKKVCIVHR